MTRPPYPMRVLALRTPPMRGPDVDAVQRRLGIDRTGAYDGPTGAHVRDWKWRVGYPAGEVNTGIGPAAQLVLLGIKPRTAAMKARTLARKVAGSLHRYRPAEPVRQDDPTPPPSHRVIERDEWGSVTIPAGSYIPARWYPGVTLWVHYTAGPAPSPTFEAEAAHMRFVQGFHRGPSRGWLDIGYHFVVGPSGRIYRGRPAQTVGAHCPGHNGEPSVCLMLGVGEEPTRAQLDAVRWLKESLNAGQLKGHRQAPYPTSCPGDAVVEALDL